MALPILSKARPKDEKVIDIYMSHMTSQKRLNYRRGTTDQTTSELKTITKSVKQKNESRSRNRVSSFQKSVHGGDNVRYNTAVRESLEVSKTVNQPRRLVSLSNSRNLAAVTLIRPLQSFDSTQSLNSARRLPQITASAMVSSCESFHSLSKVSTLDNTQYNSAKGVRKLDSFPDSMQKPSCLKVVKKSSTTLNLESLGSNEEETGRSRNIASLNRKAFTTSLNVIEPSVLSIPKKSRIPLAVQTEETKE